MKDIYIIGAGGVGRETALIIEQINNAEPTWNIIGFIDDNERLHNNSINGYKIIGGIDYLDNLEEDKYVIVAIASYGAKKKVTEKLNNKKIKYASIIHPDIYISDTNKIGEDVIIYPGVIMTTNINIGNHVIISPSCGIGHESKIGNFTSLLWSVNIAGNVDIGEGCFVGSGGIIIQNKIIGRNAIIGAGSVVINDIDENCTVVGVPGKIIKKNSL